MSATNDKIFLGFGANTIEPSSPKTMKFTRILILLLYASAVANANELELENQAASIRITIEGNSVTAARTTTKEKLTVARNLEKILRHAEDISSVGKRKTIDSTLFIILSRQPSRPDSMGRGFCGAGYEDILLLVELKQNRIELRDQYKLQSCVDSLSIYTEEHVDNPARLLALQADDSYLFRLIDDEPDQVRRLTIANKKFVIEMTKVSQN